MSVERGCGLEADIEPREAIRAVTVVAGQATVICDAFGRDMDALCLGERHSQRRSSSRRRVEESPLDRESGAPTHAERDGVAA